MGGEQLSRTFGALGSLPRLSILAELASEPTHVSELARRLGMSRPLLYAHLNRLESVGLVASRLDPSDEGHVKKHYWVTDFRIEVTPQSIRKAIEENMKEAPK